MNKNTSDFEMYFLFKYICTKFIENKYIAIWQVSQKKLYQKRN